MFGRALATLGLLSAFATPAFADEALDKRVEAAIVETIQLTSAGQFDAWINKWCDPKRCFDTAAKNEMKAYQLKSAKNFSKACLVGENAVSVKQKKGDPALKPDGVTWYLNCKGRMLGVPIRIIVKDPGQKTERITFGQLSF